MGRIKMVAEKELRNAEKKLKDQVRWNNELANSIGDLKVLLAKETQRRFDAEKETRSWVERFDKLLEMLSPTK